MDMMRACRLVVDTGLHALGWSRDRAVAYMAQHCAQPLHEVEAEVTRYIAWPGQVSIAPPLTCLPIAIPSLMVLDVPRALLLHPLLDGRYFHSDESSRKAARG